MEFKESCRYSTFLQNRIGQLENLFYSKDNYIKISENHLKNKVNPEAEDEVIEAENQRIFNCKINDIAHLIKSLIDEQLKLALAIEIGKNKLVIDWKEDNQTLTLDTAIEYNKKLRSFAGEYLQRLTNIKDVVAKRNGVGYRWNAEGNQVSYSYIIEVKNEVDYNKDVIRDLYKKILAKADKISTLIDAAQLKDVVDYTPTYDLRDTVEDIIEKYIKDKNIEI